MSGSNDALESRRRKLEESRLALEEEELEVRRQKLQQEREVLTQRSTSILRLNVGGECFDTTRSTLLAARSTFFGRLLEEDGEMTGAARDADGRLFIDRSPNGFRLVLEWLRGSLEIDKLDNQRRSQLLTEAVYYDVALLVRALHGGYDPTLLPPSYQRTRAEAMALRQRLVEEGSEAAAADAALVSVFVRESSTGVRSCLLDADPETPPLAGVPHLFSAEAARFRRPPTLPARSADDFRVRLDAFAGPLFAGLDMTNLVVAGGAVVQALMIKEDELRHASREGSADIDLFIVAPDEATARATCDRVYAHFRRGLGANRLEHRELLLLRSRMAISFYANMPQRTVQLILRRHACVADVIFSFDVDACQLAYDGQRVLATPSAVRAFRTGINIADPERCSSAYEKRLAKCVPRRSAIPPRVYSCSTTMPPACALRTARDADLTLRLASRVAQVLWAWLRRGGARSRARARRQALHERRLHVGPRRHAAPPHPHLWWRRPARLSAGDARHCRLAQADRALRAARLQA